VERIREFGQDIRSAPPTTSTRPRKRCRRPSARPHFLDEKRSADQSAVDAGKEAYQREKTKGATSG
jgi:hypothetical protein